MELSGQLHAPAALPSGKEPAVPIQYEAWWAPEPVWTRCRKIPSLPPPAGNRTPIIRSPLVIYTPLCGAIIGLIYY